MQALTTSLAGFNSQFQKILSYQAGQNTVRNFLMAFLVFVGLFVAFKLFKLVVVFRLKKLAKKTKNDFDDKLIKVIEAIPFLFYFIIALYFPLKMLVMNETAEKVVDAVFVIALVWQVIRFLQSLIEYGLESFAEKKGAKGPQVKSAFHGIRLIVKMVLWVIGLLLILSNLGFNITSLVATLGVGSIAVALAVQNILGDVLSSFSIYFDRPFAVGDFIIVGENQGTVKKIGLKSTRLETLQGEELVLSNHELTTSKIQNFKEMKKRRVTLNFGVVYETGVEKLKKINDLIKKVVDGVKGVEFSRSHFKEFGDFSLNFEVIYFVLSGDYVEYMDKQQDVNFGIREVLEKEGIEMAFPTQTIYLTK